jgi:ketosteroid isomerase-like protein
MVISTSSTLTREDVEHIRTIGEEHWVRAGLARDWDKTLDLCAPDIVYMPPDQPAIGGHRALREWLEQFPTILEFAQPIESIDGQATMAVFRSTFTVTVESEGKQLRNSGKALVSLEKNTLGRWLVKAVCFNWDGPMAGA